MAKLKDLKEYLLGDGEYLLKDDNNGKTVMLSGVWGSGKTYFWQSEIEPELSEKLREGNKACVYVSLYGKDNIEAIKNEILFKAYESIKDENQLAKRAISAFGFGSRLLSVSVGGIRANTAIVGDAVKGFFESKKIDEAESFLADGGVVCFDDFERKSKHVDLNDLFGFITQLSIDMNCKVVIILNSDVFEGEEANVFKNVKEKTVNKFFYFEPTIEELFISIYAGNEKYKVLDEHIDEILKAVKETKELNARIYIQVLDNCLEWLNQYEYDKYQLRALVLITTNFIKNHFVFEYKFLGKDVERKLYRVLEKYYNDEGLFEISNYFVNIVPQLESCMSDKEFEEYIKGNRTIAPVDSGCGCEEFLHQMRSFISKKEEDSNGKIKSDSYYERLDKVFYENKDIFYALNFYAYVLNVEYGVDKEMFDAINRFVKIGISG
jgi:hypothetical protein